MKKERFKTSMLRGLTALSIVGVIPSICLAAQSLSLGVGMANFDKTFENAFSYKGSYTVQNRSGLGLNLSASFTKATNKATNETTNIIPVTAELLYNFSPRKKVSPYIGAGVGWQYQNNTNDPEFGYTIKGGIKYKIDHQTSLVTEVEKLFIDTQNQSSLTNPMTFSVGVSFSLDKPKPKPKRQLHKRPMNSHRKRALTPYERKAYKQKIKQMKQKLRYEKQLHQMEKELFKTEPDETEGLML